MKISLRTKHLQVGLVAIGCLVASTLIGQTPTSGSLTVDAERLSGTDEGRRLLMYNPRPLEPGSSISHFDRSANPNLLMEPGIASDLPPLGLDVVPAVFTDLGWPTGNSNFSINVLDGPGVGFNHPTSGNQRRNALQVAANVFGSLLGSNQTIHIDARFQDLACDPDDGATLANARPTFIYTVGSAEFPQSWYHGALAESLAGQNLSTADNPSPTAGDLLINFNSRIDEECLGPGRGWYYGTGEEAPGQIHFINVALHEIAHGLGFSTLINATTGAQFEGRPDIFSHFLRDTRLRKTWAEMTPSEVRTSATRTGQLVWIGSRGNQRARQLLDPPAVFRIEAPSAFAADFETAAANFGPSVQVQMPSAELALARDGSNQPTLVCNPVSNRAAVRGRIAVLDRGECTFVQKVRNAQDAGAVGVVIVNNEAGVVPMGGDDPAIDIPTLMVSNTDGDTIKNAIQNPKDADDPDDGGDGGGDDPDPPDEPMLTIEGEDGPAVPPSECVVGDMVLCLLGDRFRVEANFSTGEQIGVTANSVELTDDTGYFWFFADTNVEIVVKVLDGCPVNQRFWVFAGGLTDVEVELRVTDTETGAVRLYRSEPGPLLPAQDVDAFATCPTP